MNDHDLLITIHTVVNGMKQSLDSVNSDIKGKADKTELAALGEKVSGHERRIDRIEDQHRENAVRKNEKERISEWGWKVWAKIVAAITFVIMVWQALQNANSSKQQPLTVQVQIPSSTSK